MNRSGVLEKAVVTEKSLRDAASGIFTFAVNADASKDQVAAAVEGLFGVTVVKATVTTVKPKTRRVGRRRTLAQVGGGKRAKVWLKEGQKIDLFEFNAEK